MIPHARLHPRAPISIARTSSRPASATLSEPVKVSTMISPNSTSDTRSIGSRTRLDSDGLSTVIEGTRLVISPAVAHDAPTARVCTAGP